jgi:hypothetical protein
MKYLYLALICLLSSAAAKAVEVENATVRLPLPGKTLSAGYFSIRNTGGQDIALLGVSSGQFGLIELHQHTMKDGMMQMVGVETIKVPAGQTVHLQPGGLHLMLFRPVKPLALGEQVVLTLQWSDGSRQQVSATVTKIPIK